MIINLFGPEKERFLHYFKQYYRVIISNSLKKRHLKLQKYFGCHIVLTQYHEDAVRIYCCEEKFFHNEHDCDYVITYKFEKYVNWWHNEFDGKLEYSLRQGSALICGFDNIVELLNSCESIFEKLSRDN